MAPESSKVMKQLVEAYLDAQCFTVLEGGPDVAIALSQQKFDIICFTGSTQKGALVAQAAAKNLVPCLLELGGKCPAVIDESADVDFAAQKCTFARFNNSGQTCLSTDYILVHSKLKQQFLDGVRKYVKEFYGENPKESGDMGKMVNEWHCGRLEGLIEGSKTKVCLGGKVDKAARYVEPTVIDGPSLDEPVMQEEIFGPILPILTFNNIGEAIQTINKLDKPLAVYYFGSAYRNKN